LRSRRAISSVRAEWPTMRSTRLVAFSNGLHHSLTLRMRWSRSQPKATRLRQHASKHCFVKCRSRRGRRGPVSALCAVRALVADTDWLDELEWASRCARRPLPARQSLRSGVTTTRRARRGCRGCRPSSCGCTCHHRCCAS
jgi:hypothetical protein